MACLRQRCKNSPPTLTLLSLPPASVCFKSLLPCPGLTAVSLHEASLSIDYRQACGPGHHSRYFYNSNPRFIRLFHRRGKGIWVSKETSQFCDRHGGKSAGSSELLIYVHVANQALGLWQFEFAANFLSFVTLTNYQGTTLGQSA